MKKVYCLVVTDDYSKFDGKADEGFFVGYSTNSKAYREMDLIKLFDIDALTISMNYKPVVAGNQTNGNAGTKENIDAGQDEKKTVPDQNKVLNTKEPRVNQEQDANVNSTNNINTVSLTVNASDIENNVVDENIVYGCIDDPNMLNLEEIVYFDDDEEVGAKADMNNLATTVPRINHKDFQNCLFAYFLSQVEPKKATQALTDISWIEAMHDEHLQFKLQKDWTLVELPYGKRSTAQGYTQEEGINYDEVFARVARIEAVRLFLAYASFMNFIVYQMDVKSAFLYGTIEEELLEHDETIIKEWEDKMERAAITASSLEVEQDSGNINMAQSMATLNESFAQGTNSGSGLRSQDTILGGVEAQIRHQKKKSRRKHRKDSGSIDPVTDEAHVSIPFYDLPQSGEDNASLKKRVKQLEKRRKLRTPGFKRLRKVGSASREKEVAEKEVSAADPVTTANAPTTTIDELSLAQTLIEIKAANPKAVTSATKTTTTTRPKARGVVVQEPSEFKTTSSPSQASQHPQAKDKGKAIMVEPERPLKKKDQVALDEEMARNLEAQMQAELIEEERLARKKEEEANIALIKS
ncbi:putative ribonuclease H-like domain-containing protein [Tanacetum coccineum]